MARPPSISDAQVREVIDAFSRSGTALTGLALRAELQRRFGNRAGTQRIYHLLNTRNSPPPPAPGLPDSSSLIAKLRAERDAAIARAEVAELRERATQDRTANEIWELRQEVKQLKALR